MLKIILIGAVIIGAMFGIPPIRNRIAGPLDPFLSKLGPVGEKIQAPARRWAAKNEEMLIIRKLAEDHNQNKGVPSPLAFQGWIKRNFHGGVKEGMDPWGRPYYLIHTRQQLTVGSQGPDRLRDSSDDIRVSVPLLQ